MIPHNKKHGQIKIDIRSKINYGGRATPIEIRNDDLVLIISSSSKRLFELPIGAYEISAVLEDGKRQKHTVHVTESSTAIVSLVPRLSYQPAAPDSTIEFLPAERIKKLTNSNQNVTLLSASRNVSIYPKNDFWIVRHHEEMEQVAYAIIKKGKELFDISLPISAGDHHLSVTCHIKANSTQIEDQIKINISQSRSLSAALESMFSSGQYESAARLASQAMQTLTRTFADPTGAILAALILKKAGRLAYYKSALEKIVNEFSWLPDGKILLASILMTTPKEREKAIQLAYEASQQRILYTESFSTLMSLLRYAPESENNSRYREALTNIAKIAPFVDWNSIYLCRTSSDYSNV